MSQGLQADKSLVILLKELWIMAVWLSTFSHWYQVIGKNFSSNVNFNFNSFDTISAVNPRVQGQAT